MNDLQEIEPMSMYKYDGEHCPVCKEVHIDASEIVPSDFLMAYRSCWCEVCGAEWVEHFKVIRVSDIQEKKEE